MTARNLIRAIIAIVIIGAGAAIGWAVATNTNPYATSTTPTVVAAAATVVPNTPLPTFTPAVAPAGGGAAGAGAANTTPGAGAAAGAGGQTTRQGGQGQGQRARPITATVESYDAASKVLTIKTADGTIEKVGAGNARLTKSEKLTADAFAKLITPNSIVIVTGDKGTDGTYNARTMTTVDPTGLGGGAAVGGAGAGGFPGGGGQGQAGSFGGGQGQAGGANAPIIVRGGTLDGKKFSGSTFAGDAIVANITDTTNLLKQGAGTLDDLKAGTSVIVTAPAAQGGNPAEAVTITIQ